MNIAIYTRVSDEEALDFKDKSLDNQLHVISAYIKNNYPQLNLKNALIYREAKSGGTVDKRPEFLKMTEQINKGNISHIFITKQDRISRDLLDTAEFMFLVINKKVTLIATEEKIDLTTANGRAITHIKSIFAQQEREQVSERMLLANQARAEKGIPAGRRSCYGYKWSDELNTLVVQPDQADIVKMIFNMYIKCGSFLKVANELNTMKLTSRSWNYQAVRHILMTRKFISQFEWVNRKTGETTIVQGTWEPIIDKKLFDKAEEIRKLNDERKSPDTKGIYYDNFLFRGLAVCEKCGKNLYLQSSNNKKKGIVYLYYACGNCKETHKQSVVDDHGITAINKLLEKDNFQTILRNAVGKQESITKTTIENTKKEITAREKELKQHEKQLQTYIDGLPNATTKIVQDLVNKKIEDILEVIHYQTYILRDLIDNKRDLQHDQIAEITLNQKTLNSILDPSLSIVERKVLINSIVHRIIVGKKDINIEFRVDTHFEETLTKVKK